MGEIVEETSSVLLGFRDSLPVITNSEPKCKKSTEVPIKKILKVQVDPTTGEKFINLNGKKLKMVPESQLKSQVNLLNQKNFGIKSVKSLKVVTKLPLVPPQPIKVQSLMNLDKIQKIDVSSSMPSELKETNFISLKNNHDKDCKYITDNNQLKEITADKGNIFKYTNSITSNILKCSTTQRISIKNLIDMKLSNNDKGVQTFESRIHEAWHSAEFFKDAAIQTDESSFNNLVMPSENSLDDILDILGAEIFSDPSLLYAVNPHEVNPPEKSNSLAAKFFSELRKACFPDHEGNM